MNPDQSSEPSLEALMQRFAMAQPAPLILDQRRQRGWDNPHDRFMYVYVGEPFAIGMPEVKRLRPPEGEMNYSRLEGRFFSQTGHLVIVRTCPDLSAESPARYFVASSQVETGEVNEWWVSEVMMPPGQTSGKVLTLTETALQSITGEVPANDGQTDPVQLVISGFRQRRLAEQALKNRPRLVKEAGRWFYQPGDDSSHALFNLTILERALQDAEDEFGTVVNNGQNPGQALAV